MQSRIALASSPGVAAGMCSRPALVSLKMGRRGAYSLDKSAGAGEVRLADRTPAMNVPCKHAMLLVLCAGSPAGAGKSTQMRHLKSGCW